MDEVRQVATPQAFPRLNLARSFTTQFVVDAVLKWDAEIPDEVGQFIVPGGVFYNVTHYRRQKTVHFLIEYFAPDNEDRSMGMVRLQYVLGDGLPMPPSSLSRKGTISSVLMSKQPETLLIHCQAEFFVPDPEGERATVIALPIPFDAASLPFEEVRGIRCTRSTSEGKGYPYTFILDRPENTDLRMSLMFDTDEDWRPALPVRLFAFANSIRKEIIFD